MTDPRHSPLILVADDQSDVLRALRLLFVDAGYGVETVGSPAEVIEHLERSSCDLLLIDLNYARDTTSGEEGMELLRRVRTLEPWLPVVVMTAYGSVELAVDAMRAGARDFVEKPWDNYRLLNIVRAQLELASSRRRERALSASLDALNDDGSGLVVGSAAMREVMSLVERVGASDATALVTGENGVGKGVIASALHRASGRADKPMLTVDLGTLSAGLVEAELFGHERGAFTGARGVRVGRFELADGGTLFLDEVANCPLEQQSRLLRILETGEFERLGSSTTRRTDVRLICATNSDLRADVEAGRFRRDLFYRIDTVEIHIPPLRDRPDDILPLARHFLDELSHKYRRSFSGFSPEAEAALEASAWEGNVRELAHAVERAVLLARDAWIGVDDLRLGGPAPSAPEGTPTGLDRMTLEQAERELIVRALERHGGNVREAATALGLSRSALYRRLERHGIGTQEGEESP